MLFEPLDSNSCFRMSLTLRKQELSFHPSEDSPEVFLNLWRPKKLILGRKKVRVSEHLILIARSERYFESVRYSRAAVPASYSSVDLGLVSPVKNQVCKNHFENSEQNQNPDLETMRLLCRLL